MIDASLVARAAALLRSGGVVAFPTETVYGLGANALDRHAIRRIYEIKRRPATSPLIVHAASVEILLEHVVQDWPEQASALAARFWPGPLTLVLPKQAAIPGELTAGLATVGVRIPRHPLALQLLESAKIPVAAPSANLFAQLSPTTADHVREGLGPAVDLILDGGPCAVGIESTVLSLSAPGRAVLLRPGAISKSALEEVVGPVEGAGDAPEGHQAPGMHRRHYRPVTPLFVRQPPMAGRSVLLTRQNPAPGSNAVQMPDNPAEYGAALYAVLHDLDKQHWDSIVVEPVPEGELWDAVRDRLHRARDD